MSAYLNVLLVMLVLLPGCSSVSTQLAPAAGTVTEQHSAPQDKTADEEIAPGVFVIEVLRSGPASHPPASPASLDILQQHWQRRATELCRFGFQGSPGLISPASARLPQFQCGLPECRDYLLMSGVAFCHQRFQL